MASGDAVYEVVLEMVHRVRVVVSDPSAITRVTENEDGWREEFYPLTTATEAITMFADNAVRNGVRDAKYLDGWADLPEGAVTMVWWGAERQDVSIHPDPEAIDR